MPKKIKVTGTEEVKEIKMDEPTGTNAVSEKEKSLRAEIEELKKLVYATADVGRVFNYESSKTTKHPIKAKLSIFAEGLIVGWRTVKDELVHHPTTGMTIGETQEYELLILDHEGKTKKVSVSSYPAFSNARYNERVDVELVSRSEDYSGNIVYDVKLPDGRIIKMDAKFIN